MEAYKLLNYSFRYPQSEKKALKSLNLDIKKGEFLVICGESGSGKSTLLRQLKTTLRPSGSIEGKILFENINLEDLTLREQTENIGFILQNPENQIVTDKVWHELAFGLESLGYDTPVIRKKVAEMASFFGIQNWFYKNVNELSGGQKQLLNLASIMAMAPSILILDEPTSQLDPISSSEFIKTLNKINKEIGTTIILTEHRLEEVFQIADRVIVLEKGEILSKGTVREVGEELRQNKHMMFESMPVSMRVWASVSNDFSCPISVRDGRFWLENVIKQNNLELKDEYKNENIENDLINSNEKIAVSISELWFRYEKNSEDIIKGLNLKVKEGEFLSILGGNGTGKTTTLKLMSGLIDPIRGDIKADGKLVLLPQDPETLFVKNTVRDDLLIMLRKDELRDEKVARVVKICRLYELLDRHPFDLSGGEKQRVALAKILLTEPDILLLDEPTKGMDMGFKKEFANILKGLLKLDVTIIMVSHDIEFCAMYSDRCALFFDGNVVSEDSPGEFFSNNNFYTTSANRMSRGIIDSVVTYDELIKKLGVNKKEETVSEVEIPPLPVSKKEEVKNKNKISLLRKIIAFISATISFIFIINFIKITDLTKIISLEEMSKLADKQMYMYLIFLISTLVFAFSVSKKSDKSANEVNMISKSKKKLTKRTIVASALILLTIPLTLFIGIFYLNNKKYYFISLLILLQTMTPFFIVFEGRKPKSREIVTIAALCAIAVAGRAAFFMLPQFKPVIAVTIIAGVAFGAEYGFLVGSISMLTSNMMFSQGPWTPFQMFAMGLIGFLAGILFYKNLISRKKVSLCIFGFISSIVIYGGIMNPASALIWIKELDFKILLTYYLTGLPFDLVHAIATWIFLWIGAEPMLDKLDRIKIKYDIKY